MQRGTRSCLPYSHIDARRLRAYDVQQMGAGEAQASRPLPQRKVFVWVRPVKRRAGFSPGLGKRNGVVRAVLFMQ